MTDAILRDFSYVLAVILALHGAGQMAHSRDNTGLRIGLVCTVLAVLMALIATIGTMP